MAKFLGENSTCFIESYKGLIAGVGANTKPRIWIPGGYVEDSKDKTQNPYGPPNTGPGPVVNYSQSPYVIVRFGDGYGRTLTVGNESSPLSTFSNGLFLKELGANHAVIKSFDFSVNPGAQLKLEIIDEEGGIFGQFFKSMMKCLNTAGDEPYRIEAEFGWIFRDCDGKVHTWRCGDDGGSSNGSCGGEVAKLYFMMKDMDVNYSQGKIKYTISATDLMQPIFMSRSLETFQKLKLGEQIKQLFSKSPNVKVSFKRFDAKEGRAIDVTKLDENGNDIGFESSLHKECKGEHEAQADNQNRLAVANRWLEKVYTGEGKGWTATWNVCSPDPEIIFWEDFNLDCDTEKEKDNKRSIGTFIVNGGKCSNVLDFSPKFNWIMGFGQLLVGGGILPGSLNLKAKVATQASDCNGLKTINKESKDNGNNANAGLTSETLSTAKSDDSESDPAKAQRGSRRANAIWEGIKPITADLKITGNPMLQLISNPEVVGRTCSIIVINPFHIGNMSPYTKSDQIGGSSADYGGFQCGNYLIYGDSVINPILTNKNWMIKQVSHSIKEGNYVTTIKVFLDAPGITVGVTTDSNGNPITKYLGGMNPMEVEAYKMLKQFKVYEEAMDQIGECVK